MRPKRLLGSCLAVAPSKNFVSELRLSLRESGERGRVEGVTDSEGEGGREEVHLDVNQVV